MKQPGTWIIEAAKILALKQCLEENVLQQIVRFSRAPRPPGEKPLQLGLVPWLYATAYQPLLRTTGTLLRTVFRRGADSCRRNCLAAKDHTMRDASGPLGLLKRN